jgi:protein ImuA
MDWSDVMAQTPMARERLFALREQIARLEGKPVPAMAAARQEALAERGSTDKEKHSLPLGVTRLDEALEGGVPLDGLSEIRSHCLRDATVSAGFALALSALMQKQAADPAPILWIADRVTAMEAGVPYPVGLKDYGLDPERFLHAAPRKLDEALWLAETAVESGAFAVTLLEVKGNPANFGLTESRRLSLRAKAAGRPLFLLRQSGEEEASSASFRFLVEPAPAAIRLLPDRSMLGGSIGNPVFRLTLEKSRNPAPLSLILEWNPHDRQFFPAREPERAWSPLKRAAHSRPRLSASFNRPDRPQEMGPVLAFDQAS